MWRVDDCFIHDCVFYHWMCRSDVSVILFRMFFLSFFQSWFLALLLWILTLPCLCEISFSCQIISETVSRLLGLDTAGSRK